MYSLFKNIISSRDDDEDIILVSDGHTQLTSEEINKRHAEIDEANKRKANEKKLLSEAVNNTANTVINTFSAVVESAGQSLANATTNFIEIAQEVMPSLNEKEEKRASSVFSTNETLVFEPVPPPLPKDNFEELNKLLVTDDVLTEVHKIEIAEYCQNITGQSLIIANNPDKNMTIATVLQFLVTHIGDDLEQRNKLLDLIKQNIILLNYDERKNETFVTLFSDANFHAFLGGFQDTSDDTQKESLKTICQHVLSPLLRDKLNSSRREAARNPQWQFFWEHADLRFTSPAKKSWWGKLFSTENEGTTENPNKQHLLEEQKDDFDHFQESYEDIEFEKDLTNQYGDDDSFWKRHAQEKHYEKRNGFMALFSTPWSFPSFKFEMPSFNFFKYQRAAAVVPTSENDAEQLQEASRKNNDDLRTSRISSSASETNSQPIVTTDSDGGTLIQWRESNKNNQPNAPGMTLGLKNSISKFDKAAAAVVSNNSVVAKR